MKTFSELLYLPFIVAILPGMLLTGFNTAIAQCTDTADFNDWIPAQGNQYWQVTSPVEVEEVEEIFPLAPSFFISNKEFINTRFSFDVISTNGTDDDFIGFVLGYNNPFSAGSTSYEFILLDWKARAETAFSSFGDEGFTLAEFHGNIYDPQLTSYFWGHHGSSPNAIYSPIAHLYGDNTGWQTGKSYHFDVIYSSGSIKIDLDGNRIFDVIRCNQPGRFGFYTYSQHNVIFSNLTWSATADAFISPENICMDDSIFFSLEDTACHTYNPLIQNWTWFFGDGDSISNIFEGTHYYRSPGDYELKMVAEFPGGCKDPVTKFIHVQAPFEIDLGPDTLLALHSSISLTAGPDQAGWNYLWSTGSMLNEVTLTDLTRDTVIRVYVTRDLCSAYDEIRVTIKNELPPTIQVNVPSAFSPDGDGKNDIFLPVFQDEFPEEYSLSVFNRWGQQIFESIDPEVGWDGTQNGNACPGEVYVYLIKYGVLDDNSSEITMVKKGTLLLLR